MLGVYQIAMSFFMVFFTIISSGLPLAISKRVATKQAGGIVTAGLVISLISSTIVCFAVLLFRNLIGKLFTDPRCINILIALIPSIIVASFYCVIRAVWWGEKRYFLLGITELMDQVLRMIVFAVMLSFAFLFGDMAQIAAISYTVAFAVASIIIVIIYLKIHPKKSEKLPQYAPLLRSAVPITGVRIVSSLTMPIIAVVLPLRLIASGLSSTSALASFGILMMMAFPLLTIPQTIVSSLSTALVPELSSAFNEEKKETIKRQINNSLKFTLFVNFLFLCIFISLGEGIGQLLYKNIMSGIYLSKYSWVMIPMSLSQITNAILNSLGAESRAMKNYFIGAVALFASVWFLPSVVGISALVIGMGLCMSIAATLNLILICKITNTKIIMNVIVQILAFIAFSIPAFLCGYFVFGIFRNFGVYKNLLILILSLATASAVTVSIFAILSYLFGMIKFGKFKIESVT